MSLLNTSAQMLQTLSMSPAAQKLRIFFCEAFYPIFSVSIQSIKKLFFMHSKTLYLISFSLKFLHNFQREVRKLSVNKQPQPSSEHSIKSLCAHCNSSYDARSADYASSIPDKIDLLFIDGTQHESFKSTVRCTGYGCHHECAGRCDWC